MPRKKPFKYTLEDLISEHNEDLYNEVKSQITVSIEKSKEYAWSYRITDEKAVIQYSKADAPDACFAHELLHIKYELKGLNIPAFIDNEKNSDIQNTLPFLFNNLCHLKFFDEFYELGFDEEEFLNDNDANEVKETINNTLKTLEPVYKRNGKIKGAMALLMPYIELISPHDKSELSNKQIDKLKEFGEIDFFKKVDIIIQRWVSSSSLDASLTLAKLFKACNLYKIGFCLSKKREDLIIAENVDDY